ncbi:MAG: SDR family oxidoreductase [Flavobacteriales bacterium]|nr:SDR family oxidoreductase [Flavobacteriales bacterium]
MSTYFQHKTIWITGASSGIGEALAVNLSHTGCTLILSARRVAELERVKARCQNPENVYLIPLDVTDFSAAEPAVKQALSINGKVDILINNAGVSQRSLVKETLFEVDKRIMEINFLGTVALSKALLPHFIANGSGHYVTVSSVTGKYGTPYRSAYAASKHALHGYFDSLRAELEDSGIRVTMVTPGFIKTPITLAALTGDGSPLNMEDKGNAGGLDPDYFAEKMLRAVAAGKREVAIGGFKEKFGLFMKRFFPNLFAEMIKKINVR